jgi:hypothetical protein
MEEIEMKSNSKNRFLLTTAVLFAGVSLASAQGMRESGGGMGAGGGPGGGAAERGAPGGGMSQGPGAASRGGSEGVTQGRAAEPRGGGRAESPAAGPSREGIGRAAQGERQMGKETGPTPRGQKQTIGQGRGEREPTRQSEQKMQGKDRSGDRTKDQAKEQRGQKDQTVGQGRGERERDQTRQSEQKSGQKDQGTTTGANTRPDNQDRAQRGQTGQQGQGTTTGSNTQEQTNAQGQTQDERTATQSASGRFSVSAQQQTRLQQSVLTSRNVARVNVNSINFRINTGVVVPRSVSFVSVSAYPVLIDYFPAYRDYDFFVVEDEIVFVDDRRRIVDVVPAGPRARFARGGGGAGVSGGSVAALDLSPDEIRIVQRVLIERGILIGEADGILGPDTRQALITFQRRQGIEVSGSIDTRTVAALGVSNRISATQGQSTTVGQGQSGQSTGQGQANAPAQNQPPTSGQAGTQPPQGQTTGQAPAQPQGQTTGQAPSQGGNPPNTSQNAPSGTQNAPSGQTNQNNAPPPSTSGQPAQNPPSR